MDVVDAISNVEVIYSSQNLGEDEEAPKDEEGKTIPSDKPVNPPVIIKMTVETYGVDYGEPTTVEPFDYYEWFKQTYGYDLKTLYGIE